MFSGKSTEGIRLARKYMRIHGEEKVLCVKYSGDNRYSDNKITTHDGVQMRAVNCKTLGEIEAVELYDYIFVDESQFYSDIVEFVQLSLGMGINIILAGLDADYKKKPFPNNWLSLIPYATYAKKFTAICSCGQTAPHTVRTSDETAQTVIGGADKYEAKCISCAH